MKNLITLSLLVLSGNASSMCIGNDTSSNLRVIFAENIQAQNGTVVIDKISFKNTLAPKQEDCFPDYHPQYKQSRWLAFMPVLNLNHPSRTGTRADIYYLTKPLPDFASVVVKAAGSSPKVSVYVDGNLVSVGPVRKTKISGKE